LVADDPSQERSEQACGIDLCRFNKSGADLESIAGSDVNYLVTNTRITATAPSLFVYRGVSLPCDLPVVEPVM
jgi:hypothetical protein